LSRLGYLLAETRYLDSAERTLKAAWPGIQEYPQAHMSLINALEDFRSSMQIVVIRGDATSAMQWAADLGALYAPTRMVFAIPNDAALPPALAAKAPGRSTVAYLCTGMTCSAPMTHLPDILRASLLRVS
jgi:hypothetical protein